MVTDGTWLNTNEKDTKIVAITFALDNIKKKFGKLAKKIRFSGDAGKTMGGGGGKGVGEKTGKTKYRCPA